MEKETKTFGQAIEGECLPKIPYCGQINIWGTLDKEGNVIDYNGDTGGEFERDFTGTWTSKGYKVDWVSQI